MILEILITTDMFLLVSVLLLDPLTDPLWAPLTDLLWVPLMDLPWAPPKDPLMVLLTLTPHMDLLLELEAPTWVKKLA